MTSSAQTDLRRVTQEEKHQYQKALSFIILLIVTLVMVSVTFLNPFFMKGQIRSDSNQVVVVRQVNQHFNTLAKEIGARQTDDANLLTTKQTQPIADHIIDYTLKPWFKVNKLTLANDILYDINLNIDQGASSDAQLVQEKLKKQGSNAPYEVMDAFSLNTVTVGGNVAFGLLLLNIVLMIMAVISLRSLFNEIRAVFTKKMLIHVTTASIMWAGFWLILVAGIFALIPVIINVEGVAVLGYLLEIGSSIFLDFVIVGVLLYVFSAIPWKITSPNN